MVEITSPAKSWQKYFLVFFSFSLCRLPLVALCFPCSHSAAREIIEFIFRHVNSISIRSDFVPFLQIATSVQMPFNVFHLASQQATNARVAHRSERAKQTKVNSTRNFDKNKFQKLIWYRSFSSFFSRFELPSGNINVLSLSERWHQFHRQQQIFQSKGNASVECGDKNWSWRQNRFVDCGDRKLHVRSKSYEEWRFQRLRQSELREGVVIGCIAIRNTAEW